jgi:hypothetical protein
MSRNIASMRKGAYYPMQPAKPVTPFPAHIMFTADPAAATSAMRLSVAPSPAAVLAASLAAVAEEGMSKCAD